MYYALKYLSKKNKLTFSNDQFNSSGRIILTIIIRDSLAITAINLFSLDV